MDPIRQLWSQAQFRSPFTPPNILYAFNKNNEKFIVINDHTTIYRIMNSRGQVFMIAHFRCVKAGDDKNNRDNNYYRCDEPMHIISCTKYSLDEDQYAFDVILPQVFKSP